MQENIHPQIVELEMAADGQGREAAAAYGPETEQDQYEPVAILGLASLVAADWHLERLVHELDAEVESVPGGTRRLKRSSGWARDMRRDFSDLSQAQSVVGAIKHAAW